MLCWRGSDYRAGRANFTNQAIPCAGRLRLGKNAKAESVKGD
jgi:hypothetical protein